VKLRDEKVAMHREGGEPRSNSSARRKLVRALELLGFAVFVATVGLDGPENFIGPLALGAGFVALVVALEVTQARMPAKAEAPYTPDEWFEDARASYARGTHISTLAVRYDVEPHWLEKQLRASS
jgi:hypothetical protein